MPLSRAAAAVLFGALLVTPAPAYALDEVLLSQPSCGGLQVTQRGLPAGAEFEVEVVDTRDGRELGAVEAHADAGGTLNVWLPAELSTARQAVVEVEAADGSAAEYGEAGIDLPRPCRPRGAPQRAGPAGVGAQPVSAPLGAEAAVPELLRPSPGVALAPAQGLPSGEATRPAASQREPAAGVVGGVLVAALALVLGAALLRRRRRHAG